MKTIVAPYPLIKTPRPDMIFGYKLKAFTLGEQATMINNANGVAITKDVNHAFFALEAKSMRGNQYQADLQCCRAGSAMVHARAKYNALGSKGKEGSNSEGSTTSTSALDKQKASVAFTLALHPKQATVYVHWTEKAPWDDPLL